MAADMENLMATLKDNLNQEFVVFAAVWIVFMQCGFAFLEAGSVQSKNTTSILFKNVLDMFIGAIAYWAFGYSFSFGSIGNGFISHSNYFSSYISSSTMEHFNTSDTDLTSHTSPLYYIRDTKYYSSWLYQFGFAVTSSTIVSGAMAERTELVAYLVYSALITGMIYPVAAHWAWSKNGWLLTGAGSGLQYQDFAGSGPVHITGGTAALIGCILVGPRMGKFDTVHDENTEQSSFFVKLPGHSVPLTCLGFFILYVGFLTFNNSSQHSITEPGDGVVMSLVAMNTIIASASSALASMILQKIISSYSGRKRHWSLLVTLNGALAGMVASCAGSNEITTTSSFVIGLCGGIMMIIFFNVMHRCEIDDPLSAAAVHLGGGIPGVILTPLFASNVPVHGGVKVNGVIYGGGLVAWKTVGWNLLGVVAMIIWAGSTSLILFYSLRISGLLRVSKKAELKGLDASAHGELAYPEYIRHEQV